LGSGPLRSFFSRYYPLPMPSCRLLHLLMQRPIILPICVSTLIVAMIALGHTITLLLAPRCAMGNLAHDASCSINIQEPNAGTASASTVHRLSIGPEVSHPRGAAARKRTEDGDGGESFAAAALPGRGAFVRVYDDESCTTRISMKPVTTTVTYDNLGRLTWDVLVKDGSVDMDKKNGRTHNTHTSTHSHMDTMV